MHRIFVSIASYRDTETLHTLNDLFAKAQHPERVFAGVLWQAVPGEDDDCMGLPPGVPAHQVRGLQVHPRESQGACWARHRILSELRGSEEFVLQIDSHMRFVQGWDTRMLAMWTQCASPRAILSTYPVAYTPPDVLGEAAIPVLTANAFNHRGVMTFLARALAYHLRPPKPQPNPFISAGFLFAPGGAFDEVPYDPHLYFIGEEVTMAVRLWTHGWNVHSPSDLLIYHFYGRGDARPKHWTDNPLWGQLDLISFARVRHLLGMEVSTDPQVLAQLERFGLGTARSLAQYQRYADVNFLGQHIGPAARSGRFGPHPRAQSLALQAVFEKIFADNGWKSSETRSGGGATRQATRAIVPALADAFATLQVRSLVDAGCGDLNWVADLTLNLDMYIGVDVVEALTQQNNRILGHRKNHFFKTADIAWDPLPRADAVLCRNVLTHLSLAEAQSALQGIQASGAQWLITTTHDDVTENQAQATGHWRPLNLRLAPFNLPAPRYRIADGKNKWLGIWALAEH